MASLRGKINDEALATAEPHLVEFATRSTPKELRSAVTHVIHSYAPDRAARDDDEDDYQARRFDASTTIGGMGVGSYTLHPVGQETLMTAIHALSRPTTGDLRSPTQRRADALITLAEIAMRSGELPITGGVRPHVTVTASLATLTGQPGSPAADYQFGATSSTEWARRIACDATIARVVFGPDGQILDAGRSTRTFTTAQLRAITARDRHCIWRGCDTPAGWCDAHHKIHWATAAPPASTTASCSAGDTTTRSTPTDTTSSDTPTGTTPSASSATATHDGPATPTAPDPDASRTE